MDKKCLKCGHVAAVDGGAIPLACEACGAIYAKVEAARSGSGAPPSSLLREPARQEPPATTARPAYACRKCGHMGYETGEFRASGGRWSSWFDFDTERFSFVACERCRYTEFYRVRLGQLGRVVDFLLS
jgi:predicted nucleic-acid-binding Zn-ribbon protein